MDLKETHDKAGELGTLVREALKRNLRRYVRTVYGTLAVIGLVVWMMFFATDIILYITTRIGNSVNGIGSTMDDASLALILIVGGCLLGAAITAYNAFMKGKSDD